MTLYTDLVKVGVALDDGGIVFYDARGYINNHRERALEPPAITEEEALASVNPSLTILSSRVALIPTSGQNEVLTYEFLAQSEGGQKLLTYINAATGAEEQILLLIETPGGTLTKYTGPIFPFFTFDGILEAGVLLIFMAVIVWQNLGGFNIYTTKRPMRS